MRLWAKSRLSGWGVDHAAHLQWGSMTDHSNRSGGGTRDTSRSNRSHQGTRVVREPESPIDSPGPGDDSAPGNQGSSRLEPRPPVELPPWLRVNGAGARARLAAGEGPCLWTGKRTVRRVSGVEASPDDVERVIRALHPANGPQLQANRSGARAITAWTRKRGLRCGVLPRDDVAAPLSQSAREAAGRWLYRICGKPVGLLALMRAWKAAHPEHWDS